MNDHALRLLDLDRVREDAAAYCLSEEGRVRLGMDAPLVDRKALAERKEASQALLAALRGDRVLPTLSFFPIGLALRRAAKEGGTLEIEELYAIGLWADSFFAFAEWLAKMDAPIPEAIAAILEPRPDLSPVSRILWKILNKDGSLKDLPELREARDRIARTHREIGTLTDSYFRNPETRALLQSDEPTIRDGRTVLALRANFRGRIKGIVHEVSATGQTVFVEPEELVQKNNLLVQEEARYRLEVARILRETSAALRPHVEGLLAAREGMAILDGFYARARQAKAGGLVFARDLEAGFVVRNARHPALGSRAVPIDVELPEDTRTLLITGPNTGGKTVTLKTIGLFALMNQLGFALPAAPETGFAVFDEVFADIGDEQSIDQSLSTFSGHMRVIGSICAEATARSLVLLDELGSGTDPEEGVAVAMSLLDFFIERGSLTILTTHHGILKNYGYTRPGCLNASMDFDASSLQPTYRVLMGVPGESRALDIAAQHGLPAAIVEGARGYLAEERADVSALIRGLSEKHRRLEDLETEREGRLKEAKESQRKADLSKLKVRQKELELREQGVGELRRLLAESRKSLENLVRDLREGGITPERTREVKDFLSDLAVRAAEAEKDLEEFRADRSGIAESAFAPAKVFGAIGPGSQVLAGKAKKRGVVIRPGKKGQWLIETENVRLTLPESDLTPVEALAETKAPIAIELAPRGDTGRSTAVFELDLRGYRLAAALEAVEKQIDAASIQGLSLFSLLHGTGEGILGKGIHEFLRDQAAVADYHFARPEEGGYGKTIVRLK